ncbi:MAG: peptidoglycan bridge formation glycyltransferase FemA/FemB family protein [Bacteroidales bacterium]|jgi:lipid II:glycine glycyltransferase (peptidoglycan interpeptide bridge formation enzyme)|nr:peptidoglycan bridge formation glycyltransferase FemA/FemB family protein [Bacteroidales bacterium]
MHLSIERKPTESLHRRRVLPQTSYWARVKEKQGYQPRAFTVETEPVSLQKHSLKEDLLIIIRTIGKEGSVAYIPYGPDIELPEEEQGVFLEELSEALRPYLPSDCIFIRYDLSWASPWQDDEDCYNESGVWLGPPEIRLQELRMNFDTQNWNLRKAPSDILPSHTLFLNLKKDKDELLQSMKSKTRYNIRLSHRKGVRVKDVSADNLWIWHKLYQETAIRNGIAYQDIHHFKTILETRAEDTASPAEVHMLLAEEEEEEEDPLAALLMVISGGRATYLYGASTTKKRNLMGTYALQWEAICKAKSKGCKEYDFFGISPTPDKAHPMYGLYRFKKGFGGSEYHRQGCWDYPLQEEAYEIYRSVEISSKGYYV